MDQYHQDQALTAAELGDRRERELRQFFLRRPAPVCPESAA